ncbi:unnamed protein product [Pleuronectes platessa]|uniref:Uncharacterized protein n=1 Tax=Pleuronectes platessa TaxID=8262 RepID=A0A9N7YTD7_PLEPL|nr:unnamed protein product [Pleuronectes platessa]
MIPWFLHPGRGSRSSLPGVGSALAVSRRERRLMEINVGFGITLSSFMMLHEITCLGTEPRRTSGHLDIFLLTKTQRGTEFEPHCLKEGGGATIHCEHMLWKEGPKTEADQTRQP